MTDEWPSAGTLLATRYRLVALLETGGMAQIWHADDELLGRPVAIKLPTGPQVAWREARMAAKLSHPAIAAVHDYREAIRTDGTVAPFVVMELLAGETVAARLVHSTFTWQEAARVGAAVADALAAAHASGVVHRDIKPGNVMLTPTGVKILDFGISAAAGEPDDDDTGATFGTPAYVAPERLDGMPAEPATDVYGLGVLLFEMVTGQPPYPVETWEELDAARAQGPGTLSLSLPASFRAVVDQCLSADPAARPPAGEVRFDLTALWLADQPAEPDVEPAVAGAEPERSGGHGLYADVAAGSRGESRNGRTGYAAVIPAPGQETAIPAARQETAVPGSRREPAVPAPRRETAGQRPGPAREPRAAELRAGRSPSGGTSTEARTGYAAGRVSASTLPMTEPPQRRRLALVLAVLTLLVAAGGIYAVVNRPRERTDAAPAAPTGAATPFASPEPTAEATTAAPAAAPTTSPTPKLTVEDAVSHLRTAVENGAATGKIRSDIATDLLNLVRPLGNADAKNVDAQVTKLRRKISDRVGEGSLSATQAAILRSRLTDVDRAAGM